MKFMKLGSKPDTFEADGNNVRFVATELATDIIITVGGIKYYLHKFPLLSKCACLQRLVTTASNESCDEINIPDIPGGPTAFELCAKFCYGMTVTLNAYNVVAVRCASEYLEMDESLEKGNLIYKIDVFLNSSIFRSWKDSIIVLQTTKSLLPWSENLKVISRCIDSIASRASVDTSKVEWSYTYNRKKLPTENGLDTNWNGVKKQQMVPKDWWVEDLCDLDMDFYKRLIVSIKDKGRMSDKVIGEALKAYAYRRLPGFRNDIVNSGCDGTKNRLMIETIIWLLPAEVGSVKCGFLFKLLRAASSLNCSDTCKKELVKKIGRQLEEASVPDLLVLSAGETTIYDIDVVLNIVEEFISQEEESTCTSPHVTDEVQEIKSPSFVSEASKLAVTKLIDGYLAEISRDPNLPLTKFIDLAEMVSGTSRPVHDALYRAIDMYLKEHPGLSKLEKKRICHLMDCKKLSVDACMHAVQNERLPLRVVVQVLFFQQMRASASTSGGMEPPANDRPLLPQANGGSSGSSKSAGTTNTEDEWDAAQVVDGVKTMTLPGRDNDGGNGVNKNGNDNGGTKSKGMMMPKKMLSKLWSIKSHSGENSSSDTSESPDFTNIEESKSTLSRNIRNSLSRNTRNSVS